MLAPSKRKQMPRIECLEDRCLLSAGYPDTSFGFRGIVETPFQAPVGGGLGYLATDALGRIVVLGQGGGSGTASGGGIARLEPNGALDSSFGVNGRVAFDPPGFALGAVAIAQNGDILVGATNTQTELAVFALTPSGGLDDTFGLNGEALIPVSSSASNPYIGNMVVQPDGKILVTGTFESLGPVRSFVVSRLITSGSLDSTFGNAGSAVLNVGGGNVADDMIAFQADGRIVVAGATSNGPISVQRLNADGTTDTSFALGGGFVTSFGAGLGPTVVLVQADQSVVIAGLADSNNAALERVTPSGNPDASFGMNGVVSDNGVTNIAGLVQAIGGDLVLGGVTGGFSSSTLVLDDITPAGAISRSSSTSSTTVLPSSFIQLADGRFVLAGLAGGPQNETLVAAFQPDRNPDPKLGSVLLTSEGPVDSSAFSILIQPDGRLVAVGAAGPNLALARYAPDGSLDPSFGQGGTVLTPVTAGFPDVSAGLDEKVSAVLENDGKILAVVPIGPNSFAQEALLVRYNSDGTLDTSFGSGGEIQLAIPNYTVIPADVTLQPDGKMVIAATVTLTTVPEFGLFEPTSEFGVIRLTAAGALDPSFGNGGIAIQGFPIPQNAAAEAIALQPDGRIVVAGEDLASFTESIAVLRFTSSGNLDNTWGQGGIVTANFGTAMNSAAGVAIQPDGKVVVAGTTNGIGSFDLNGDFGLLRFKSNGSPDLSFGDRGIVRVAFTPQQSRAEALTLQPDGGILVAGRTISNGRQLVALTRFETNGNLDPAFFGGGTVTTLIGNGAEALGIALQADGNIVVSGDVTDSPSSTTNFLLARYLGGPTTPAPVLTPNEMYVNQVYLDLLGRQADPAGLMSFSDQLDQGISRMRVALEIEGSLEYRTIEVENLYQKVLKRGADLPGLQYWVSYLVNGGIYNVAEAGFIASPEYAAHIPSGPQSQAGFVNAVYGTVLNRAPDPAGLQSWLGKLSHGASLAAVALAIIGSQEAALDLVESLYPTYLGRAADPAGLASFTNLLLFGAPPELVTAIILGSAEYFANLN